MTTQEQAAGADPAATDVEQAARSRVILPRGDEPVCECSECMWCMECVKAREIALDQYRAAIEQRVHEQYAPLVEALKAAEWGRQSALNGWPAMVCPLCGATAPYPVEDYFNPGDGSHEADCLIGIALASLKEATDGE